MPLEEKTYTVEEAYTYLGISRATFFKRIHDLGIKPVNHNPALARQKKPKYSQADINRISQSGDLYRAA